MPPPSIPSPPKSPVSHAAKGRPTMAASAMAAHNDSPRSLPRNSSIDAAISAVASNFTKGDAHDDRPKNIDMDGLIKAAGSPEAIIQHLLKEKQSQHQQNTQLWRLVDKQRAMVLGLNKDLEQALKDKEKYRRKLKELMAIPAVQEAAGAHHGRVDHDLRHGVPLPLDVASAKAPSITASDSPSLDSDSLKHSPVDGLMAPYPITPPADRPREPQSDLDELVDPNRDTPESQEHATHKSRHEADERIAEDGGLRLKGDRQLREIPFNVSLPPSRSIPSDPPKVPPPNLPGTSAATSASGSASDSPPDQRLARFPAPPRKAPPAPLQLKPAVRREAVVDEDDTDSDYDHLLEVEDFSDERRGRRRTRGEDMAASRNRSVSRHSASELAVSAPIEREPWPSADDTLSGHGRRASRRASTSSTMPVDVKRGLAAPSTVSPGLPKSPRPSVSQTKTWALSPAKGMQGASAPLSPRPPRHAIPLPPSAPPQSSSPGAPSPPPLPPQSPPAQQLPPAAPRPVVDADAEVSPTSDPPVSQGASPERIQVYKGLVSAEYPDLLLPPSALSSITIKVASSRMKPSRASLLALTQLDEDPVFTLAIILRADGGELWRVEKDIMSFAKLDQRLKQCTAFTAKTPERSLFSGHAPAKLDARRVALEQYMSELLETPLDTATAAELCRYLSTNTLPPNADETGTAMSRSPDTNGYTMGPEGRPIRSGYLTKKGKNFGGWKARFFTIDGPRLKYYETPGGTHLGTIKLARAQIGRQSQSTENQAAMGPNGEELANQYRHAFLVMEPKKKDSSSHVKHVLCAESDEERDLWVNVLLKWIDYREADDGDVHPSPKTIVQDRHTSMAEPPTSAGGPRGKKGNHHGRSSHQTADSDSLIDVRYDSTQARDAPLRAPRGTGASSDASISPLSGGDAMSSQAGKVISGPRDPQVISDSAAWGNRMGGPMMTMEDKKQKKRSFFGFGSSKTRPPSDSQDSVPGGSDGSPAPGQSSSQQGMGRQVFGAQLSDAVRFCSPVDVDVPLPCVVYRCIEYLEQKNGIREEGIFRLSGSNMVIKQLRERFNTEGDVNLMTDDQYYDIHAVASLLKLYLRELPTTILTRELEREFLASTEIPDAGEKIAALQELARRLPQINATLLKYLISFLIKIIHNADVNKMNVRNVGIVFSPTLNIPPTVFALFLQHYQDIFGVDPERYEPPSSGTPDQEQRPGRASTRIPRAEKNGRTSTSSGGSASPRRRLPREARREKPRSTPTPPLGQISRASPTGAAAPPPPQPSSSRATYENGHSLPAGHDAYHHYIKTQRYSPGFDRPGHGPSHHEGQSAEQAPPQGIAGKGRESTAHIGAAGSKSRLREQARF